MCSSDLPADGVAQAQRQLAMVAQAHAHHGAGGFALAARGNNDDLTCGQRFHLACREQVLMLDVEVADDEVFDRIDRSARDDLVLARDRVRGDAGGMILPVAKPRGSFDAGVISSIFPFVGGKIKVSRRLKPVKQHLTTGSVPVMMVPR